MNAKLRLRGVSRCRRCSLEHSARHLLGKCECDRLLVDAATAVLQQCAQLGSHDRRHRLGREAAAAVQSIEQAVADSIGRCDQGSVNEQLQQAQVWGWGEGCKVSVSDYSL